MENVHNQENKIMFKKWSYFTLALIFVCVFAIQGCGPSPKKSHPDQISSLTSRDHFIKIGNVNYHYQEYPGTGQDVFLLHGFGSSTYTWEKMIPHLTAKNYHIWSLDMKGFGWSDKPAGQAYDVPTLMKEVNQFMEIMGLKNVVFVGNSLGGAIGAFMAVEHPEKIQCLVLIDAAGYPQKLPLIVKMARLPWAGLSIKLIFGKWMVKWNLRDVFYHKDWITNTQVDAYYDRLCYKNALEAQIAVTRAIDFGIFEKYIKNVPELDTPTFIIWGENDTWVPLKTVGYTYRKNLRHSVLAVIPSCGHIPQEEFPQKTGELIANFAEGKNIPDSPMENQSP